MIAFQILEQTCRKIIGIELWYHNRRSCQSLEVKQSKEGTVEIGTTDTFKHMMNNKDIEACCIQLQSGLVEELRIVI